MGQRTLRSEVGDDGQAGSGIEINGLGEATCWTMLVEGAKEGRSLSDT